MLIRAKNLDTQPIVEPCLFLYRLFRDNIDSKAVILLPLLLLLSACMNPTSLFRSTYEKASDFEIVVYGNENYVIGDKVSLSDFDGYPVLINFWYPSCPPCRLEIPDLEAAWQKHRARGLKVIGIQSLVLDTIEEGQGFTDEFGITYAVGPDIQSDILIKYGVVSWPTSIFLNKDHKLVRTWVGVINEEKLDEIIEPLLQ